MNTCEDIVLMRLTGYLHQLQMKMKLQLVSCLCGMSMTGILTQILQMNLKMKHSSLEVNDQLM
jgi:hypothetical protein